MKKNRSRGFSMTEVIITLVIVGILAAIAVPSVLYFIDHSNTVKHSNIARSIFVAVQSELSNKKNNGTLSDLSQFTLSGSTLTLEGGHLFTASGSDTCNKLDPAIDPEIYAEFLAAGEELAYQKDLLYYLSLSKDGQDDPFLAELLKNVAFADDQVLNNSICVELNAGSGTVSAVFYSEVFDSFVYDGSSGQNNLTKYREPSAERGVYKAEASAIMDQSALEPKIRLVDGGDLGNALYCEAFITKSAAEAAEETEEEYTITLTSKTGTPLVGSNGKPYAITFTRDGISEFDLPGALARQYTDSKAAQHAGSVVNNVESDKHTVFASTGLVDPSGGSVNSHYKITWVLDLLDANIGGITFKNSINVKYPDIGIQDITARINFVGSDASFASNAAHSYYALATSNTYFVRDARHFSNMRYVATNLAFPFRNFILLSDIDFAPIAQFAPLNWYPSNDFIMQGIFTANVSGIKSVVTPETPEEGETSPDPAPTPQTEGESSSFKLKNIRIETNHGPLNRTENTGLFGVVWDSAIAGICLENATIATRQGGNIGALAGSMKNSRITLAAVSANVSVLEPDADDYSLVNAGGIVGTMENSYVEQSFSSGSYAASGYGTLTVSGHYSDKMNIGGLVGYVVSGRVSSSYNNARVNITAAAQDTDTYQVHTPTYAALTYTTFKDISIGGVVGKNEGLVQYCYSTNFVGDYYSALDEANCGTIIGNNIGQSVGCVGLYNGVPYEMLGSNISGQVITADDLKDALDTLGGSFEAGNLTSRPGSDYHLAKQYPYPVLTNNVPCFTWENIYSPVGFDLIGHVYFEKPDGAEVEYIRAETDPLHNNYVKVDLSNPSADNYIDKLRIDVQYKGFSPLYARVQVILFMVDRDTGLYIQPNAEDLEYTEYTGPSPANQLAWISSYGNDESFYYTVALRPNNDEVYNILPFSTGAIADYAARSGSDHMYLKVIASGVEPTKVTDFWSISKLPWR